MEPATVACTEDQLDQIFKAINKLDTELKTLYRDLKSEKAKLKEAIERGEERDKYSVKWEELNQETA